MKVSQRSAHVEFWIGANSKMFNWNLLRWNDKINISCIGWVNVCHTTCLYVWRKCQVVVGGTTPKFALSISAMRKSKDRKKRYPLFDNFFGTLFMIFFYPRDGSCSILTVCCACACVRLLLARIQIAFLCSAGKKEGSRRLHGSLGLEITHSWNSQLHKKHMPVRLIKHPECCYY